MASAGKDLKGSVFLEALAEREEANKNGRMAVSPVNHTVWISLIVFSADDLYRAVRSYLLHLHTQLCVLHYILLPMPLVYSTWNRMVML